MSETNALACYNLLIHNQLHISLFTSPMNKYYWCQLSAVANQKKVYQQFDTPHFIWDSLFVRAEELSYLPQEIGALFSIPRGFALVARQLDAVVPFAFLCDSTAREFHDDVHGFGIRYVTGQKGAHAIAVLQIGRASCRERVFLRV